mgnify:CR=1 FL=1
MFELEGVEHWYGNTRVLAIPSWRAAAGDAWLLAVQAVVSALLFLLTSNLWVCLAVHWALSLLSVGLRGRQR